MTEFGSITSFDSSAGRGTITPEMGGAALAFRTSDLAVTSVAPVAEQRYGYDVRKAGDGKSYAINLRQQNKSDTHKEQAEAQKG
ncbi:MAG: cold-shock protein [Sphingopyxis sp.]|nr:cold-shock protein [Sphingopyxis sp.]